MTQKTKSPHYGELEEKQKEVVTSQGAFPLDGRGLPGQETILALFDELDYQGAVQAYLWGISQMDTRTPQEVRTLRRKGEP